MIKMQSAKRKAQNNGGQSALALLLSVGGLAVIIAVAVAFLAVTLINSTYGAQASSRAFALSSAGAYDGIIRVVRNKDFSNPVGYQVPLGSYSANVKVVKDSPITGQNTIASEASFRGYQSKIQAILSVDAFTGQVRVISFKSL